ncbi:2TM domain-containing protein [Arenibacter nanhaiticus]|uniref:2TM domain-containing protein n=1 Tax=Arenibacter nanhaiticus TaxID=558155 RepID=A0A1M6E7V5_9FLAO|nr:2TM domain-containing protein [Arenibacter nanhaiticus]SHI81552.1 2TM domain-containing protein [Arenibacter nanhaiticus]
METDSEKRKRAEKRIEELKGFYIHLIVYILVNSFVSGNKIIRNLNNGETFGEALWDFGTFALWGFWGIGIFFHGVKTFHLNPFFSKDWEERQIKKYMDEEQKDFDKYR